MENDNHSRTNEEASHTEELLTILNRIMWVILAVSAVKTVSDLTGRNFFSKLSDADITNIMEAFICMFIAVAVTTIVIRPLAGKFTRVKTDSWMGIPVCIFAAVYVLNIFLKRNSGSGLYELISSEILLLLSVIYLVIDYVLKARNNSRFFASVGESVQDQLRSYNIVETKTENDQIRTWYVKYLKKNKKREEKGETPITEEAYLSGLARKYNLSSRKRITLIVIVVFTAIVLLQYWLTASYGAAGILSGIGFMAGFFLIEAIIGLMIWRAEKTACQTYEKMIRELKKSGLTYEKFMQTRGTGKTVPGDGENCLRRP